MHTHTYTHRRTVLMAFAPTVLLQAGTWKYVTGINITSSREDGGLPFYNKTLVVTSLMVSWPRPSQPFLSPPPVLLTFVWNEFCITMTPQCWQKPVLVPLLLWENFLLKFLNGSLVVSAVVLTWHKWQRSVVFSGGCVMSECASSNVWQCLT